MIRLVIDTNLYVSAMINLNSRTRLNIVLQNEALEILADEILLTELYEVLTRPKFSRYLDNDQVTTFMTLLNERCKFITTKSRVNKSPDPKDNFLLALSLDGLADYLLTGDKVDLLDLKQFEGTKIITLTEFIKIDFQNLVN